MSSVCIKQQPIYPSNRSHTYIHVHTHTHTQLSSPKLERLDVFLPLYLKTHQGGHHPTQGTQARIDILQTAEGNEQVTQVSPEVQPHGVHFQLDPVSKIMSPHGVHLQNGVVQLGLKLVQFEDVIDGGSRQSNQPCPQGPLAPVGHVNLRRDI